MVTPNKRRATRHGAFRGPTRRDGAKRAQDFVAPRLSTLSTRRSVRRVLSPFDRRRSDAPTVNRPKQAIEKQPVFAPRRAQTHSRGVRPSSNGRAGHVYCFTVAAGIFLNRSVKRATSSFMPAWMPFLPSSNIPRSPAGQLQFLASFTSPLPP